MSERPYIAIGNGELDDNPNVGKTVVCSKCHKEHRVQYGEEVLKDGTKIPSRFLAFAKCGKTTYLVGVDGKLLR